MNPASSIRVSSPAGPVPEYAPIWNRQRHSQMPSHRYSDVYSRVEVPLTERVWPTRRLTHAPLWVPVDLRDGNQALAEPMDPPRKRRFSPRLTWFCLKSTTDSFADSVNS